MPDAGALNPGRVEALWRKYAETVIPPGSPSVQVDTMRATFFAGALAVFLEMTSTVSEEGEPTENDLRMVGEIHDELWFEANRYAQRGLL